MITFIYILWDPRDNGKCYIGKSNDPHKRFSTGHMYKKLWNTKSKKHSWLKSLSNKNLKPILEVIDQVELSDWEFWEQHYICLYKSWGFNLTNGTAGGGGPLNYIQSEETKLKKSLAFKNKTYAERFGENEAIIQKQKRSEAANKKWSKPPLHQLDLEGNFIKEWVNMAQASEDLKIRLSDISAVLNGKQKTCKGFKWQYNLFPKEDKESNI